MGAWGPGLYSDDFALDLRPAVRTLRRLPLAGDEIVAVLAGLHPAADAQEDQDHPTFWMVVADQLHGAGIASSATARAIELIRSGAALAASEELGMNPSDIRKRRAALEGLAAKLDEPLPHKKRSVLKKPQPLLLEPGQVYTYPADSCGNGINPYFSDAEISATFEPTCWGSMLVSAAGHEFEFLAWYRLTRSGTYTESPPDFGMAVRDIDPTHGAVGPLTATHLRRQQLELVGRIDGFEPVQPDRAEVIYGVANEISVSGTAGRGGQARHVSQTREVLVSTPGTKALNV